jgi:hypothetical protein
MRLRASNNLIETMRRLFMFALICSLPISVVSQTTRSRAAQKAKPRSGLPTRKVELTPRQIAALIFPSSVSIYVLGDDGDLYSGAGFIRTGRRRNVLPRGG